MQKMGLNKCTKSSTTIESTIKIVPKKSVLPKKKAFKTI